MYVTDVRQTSDSIIAAPPIRGGGIINRST